MIKEALLQLTPSSIIRFLARPYVAGYSMMAGLDQAQLLLTQGLLSTIDLLGEEATSPADVSNAVKVYQHLISGVAEHPSFQDQSTRPTVSLKLSALVVATIENDQLKVNEAELTRNLATILDHARANKVEITIDMEDYHWTDLTLKLYTHFFRNGFDSLGTVLQTRLFRTEKDIEKIPDNARIRLCIGIYKEAAERAYTDKRDMKELLLNCARILLKKNVFLEFATHDEIYLHRFFSEVIPDFKYPQDRLEIQMLLGVPRGGIQKKLRSGNLTQGKPVPIRLYVPFAVNSKDSTAYSRRRLIANPDLMTYGLKNIVARLTANKGPQSST